MNKLSVCLLIRDESEYLKEWLEYYSNFGFDHIYIYDDRSQNPISINTDYITTIRWEQSMFATQIEAYTDCIARFKDESEWIAFFDIDEFIRINDGRDLKTYLDSLDKNISGIYIPWEMHGANGQLNKNMGGVRDRFPTPLCMDGRGKCIVRCNMVSLMFPHWPVGLESQLVNADNSPLENWQSGKNCGIVLEHYYTRSWEEWCDKIKRGSCMPDALKKKDEFFIYNPDMRYLLDEKGVEHEQQKYNVRH